MLGVWTKEIRFCSRRKRGRRDTTPKGALHKALYFLGELALGNDNTQSGLPADTQRKHSDTSPAVL